VGDRCYLEFTFHPKDAPKVREAFCLGEGHEFDPAKDAKGVLVHIEEEANYACRDNREEMAKAGVVFVGSHGDGCEYDGVGFAAFGGRMIEVCHDKGGNIVAAVDPETGKANKRDLELIRAYIAMRRKARKALGIPEKART